LEHKGNNGLTFIRAKKPSALKLLERLGVNNYLAQAQKSVRCKEMLFVKVAHLLGLLTIEEEDRILMMRKMTEKQRMIDHNSRKNAFLTGRVGKEEEAKRRTLLRYVDSVKELAAEKAGGGGAILQLPSSSIGDEEVHAIVALLRNEKRVATLNLRDNAITDVGARAIAALLSTTCPLRSVDLRGNKISNNGVRALAEALERCPRVRHVYVHAGNKIEALGTETMTAENENKDEDIKTMAVTTICAVDARNNNPEVSNDVDMEKEMKRDMNQTHDSTMMMRAVHEDIKKKKGPAARTSRRAKAATASARRRKKEKQAWATLSINDRPLSRSATSSSESIKEQQKQKDKWPQDRTKKLKEARRILREEKKRRQQEKMERGWQGRSGGSDYNRPSSSAKKLRHDDQDTKTTTLPPLGSNTAESSLRIQRPPTAGSALTDMSSMFEKTMDRSVEFGMDVSTRAARDAADAVLSPTYSGSSPHEKRNSSNRRKKKKNKKKKNTNFNRRLQSSPLKTR